MKRTIVIRYLISLLLLSCIVACTETDRRKKSQSALYIDYISAYTSGIIHSNGTIKVRLAKDIEDAQVGQEADKALFEFKPSIAGSVFWEDRRTLAFQPKEKLPSGTKYEARFALHKLITAPEDREKFYFTFQTIQQAYDVKLLGLETYGQQDLEAYKLIGKLQTADVVMAEKVEKIIRAEQKGRSLSIKWYHESELDHRFEIENIQRKEEPGELRVSWDGKPIGVDDGGEEKVIVPSLGDYSVLSASLVQNEEQYISVLFSSPLSTRQDMAGLFAITGSERDTSPRWVVNKNELKIYPSQSILGNVKKIILNISQDIKSYDEKKLVTAFSSSIEFPRREPEVRLKANKGVIMLGGEEMILPFEAVGLKAVDVTVVQIFEDNVLQYLQVNQLGEKSQLKRVAKPVRRKRIDLQTAGVTQLNTWNRYTLDLSELFDIQKGAMYQIAINFRKNYSLYFCPGLSDSDGLQELKEDWTAEEESSYWDDDEYGYNYSWNERNNPCHPAYYSKRREVSKIVFASELGLIAKRGNQGDLHVFVADLSSTAPVKGVKITAYDFQQQVLNTGETSADGKVQLAISDKPFAIVARKDEQIGYLKLEDGASLSLSSFDVSGQEVQKGIKGFLYGERGVWRPGDTLHLNFILEDKGHTLPQDHPVVLELYNPQGQLHSRNVSHQAKGGIYSFLVNTPPQAPTGNWSARVKVGNSLFNRGIKIEAIKPNRLKVKLDFGKERLSISDKNVSAQLSSQWLHGATASNLKATVDLTAMPTTTYFKQYPNFTFDDPTKEFYANRKEIFSGRLNEEGVAQVNIRTDVGENAPGALKAIFSTKVFEEGGDFSINTVSVPFYPYASFVGLKVPEGDKRNMLLTDKDHRIEIAAVDALGKPVNREDVKVALFKLNWKWWWDNSYEDLSNYVGRSYSSALQEETLDIRNGRGEWSLKINYPVWGRYYVRITDPVSGHSAGKVIYMDWPGWAGKGRNELGGASMLSFTTDKETYQVGEKATLFIPSGKGGRALVSLETGTQVINSFWVETEDEKTTVDFEVTEDMAPNVYVHVSLLQPHAQTVNDLPIRLYGVNSISVEDPATRLYPIIQMPDVLQPEAPFTVRVKEQQGQPMAYTLAIVDEGLLDLTNFKTPSPWKAFYAREALGIKTWDVYDHVIGAYGAKVERLLAIGGDDEIRPMEEKKESRFKPVVKHLGPFYLEKGNEANHTITLPPYIGSVRTMLVAAHQGAYGSAEATTPVKQSLMVLPTLPRVVGPGEDITLPVNVFAMEDKVGKAVVTISTSGLLKTVEGHQKTVEFSKSGEKMVFFRLRADEAIGTGKVMVEVSSGKAKSNYEVALEMRAANPKVTHTVNQVLAAGKTFDFTYVPPGILGTNEAILEISSLPPLNLEQRLQYLIRYPHGCIEQTTSSVFAQLYLDELTDIDEKRGQSIQKNIEAAIERLKSFQLANGGFSYWPGESHYSAWGTNYAGHFLLEARKKGYFVPNDLLNDWAKFQHYQALQWNPDGQESDHLIQAYRLYTLTLMDKPAVDAMNRMRESDRVSPLAQWRLALAYARIGQVDPARQLVEGLAKEVKTYQASSATYGSKERDQAMILETLTYLNRQDEAFEMVRALSGSMSANDRWMSTQTTAYCLVAISEYAKHFTANGAVDVGVSVGSLNTHHKSGKFITQIFVDAPDQRQPMRIENKGEQSVYVQFIKRGVPMAGDEREEAKNINLSVAYKAKDGTPLSVDQLAQGQDFIAEVTVHNPGLRGDYEELALTQIFPSGWEIINTRLDGTGQYVQQDKPEYQDLRDDRVHTYFDLKAHEKKVFKILLNASYQGQYYLPAVSVEAMYDHAIHAHTQGKWVQVHK